MAVIKGKDGTVKVGSDSVANVTSWTLTQEADLLETSAMGTGGAKTFVGSLTSWSGSVECYMDSTDDQHADLPIGTIVVGLELDSANSGSKYTGNAVITSASSTVGAADIVTISFDFQGTDTLTIA